VIGFCYHTASTQSAHPWNWRWEAKGGIRKVIELGRFGFQIQCCPFWGMPKLMRLSQQKKHDLLRRKTRRGPSKRTNIFFTAAHPHQKIQKLWVGIGRNEYGTKIGKDPESKGFYVSQFCASSPSTRRDSYRNSDQYLICHPETFTQGRVLWTRSEWLQELTWVHLKWEYAPKIWQLLYDALWIFMVKTVIEPCRKGHFICKLVYNPLQLVRQIHHKSDTNPTANF
jgi:hypothetical protein